MYSLLSLPVSPTFHPRPLPGFSSPGPRPSVCTVSCCAKSPKSPPNLDSGFGNALLKLAWYGSELLGIAASSLRTQPQSDAAPVGRLDVTGDDGAGVIDRALVVETIRKDFERSYFVTGLKNLNTLFGNLVKRWQFCPCWLLYLNALLLVWMDVIPSIEFGGILSFRGDSL